MRAPAGRWDATDPPTEAPNPSNILSRPSLSGGEAVMIARLIAVVLAGAAMASPSAVAEDLAPGSGYSIRLARFHGTVYYTLEKDGYRVVATLASGAAEPPIRFIST